MADPKALAAAIKADAARIHSQPKQAAHLLAQIGQSADQLAALAVPAPAAAPAPAAGPAWSTTADLSSLSNDTYAYCRQLYAVASGQDTTGAAAQFTQGPDWALSQLAELLGSIIGDGAQMWPVAVYPVLPQAVLDAVGPAINGPAAVTHADAVQHGRYTPRPEAAAAGL